VRKTNPGQTCNFLFSESLLAGTNRQAGHVCSPRNILLTTMRHTVAAS
jgi:hypothetical protein